MNDEYIISQNQYWNSEELFQNDLSCLKEHPSVRRLRICGKSYVSRLEAPKFDINGIFAFRNISSNLVSLKLENIRLELNEVVTEQWLPNLEYILLDTCYLTDTQLRKLLINQTKLK